MFLHHAVDDHSQLAYSERLRDERGETAAAFWIRARAFFAEHHITVIAVMTDNVACYRSRVFAAALGKDIKHRRTRPIRPQSNGKVERFNRTLATEWAFARPYACEADREAASPTGYITTITTDPTAESAASSPQPAFTTSRGRTPEGCAVASALGLCRGEADSHR